jgi:hypothetical protein
MVISVPTPLAVQGDKEQVGRLKPFKDGLTVFSACNNVTQGSDHMVED